MRTTVVTFIGSREGEQKWTLKVVTLSGLREGEAEVYLKRL